jgi:hypothetical protein
MNMWKTKTRYDDNMKMQENEMHAWQDIKYDAQQ